MRNLIVILGDQLSPDISSLSGFDPAHDHVLMCEIWQEATYVKHHKKKIALIFSAMRHFAKELLDRGFTVHYTPLDHPENTHTFEGEVQRLLHDIPFERVIVTEPGEYRVRQNMETWTDQFSCPVEIRTDDRFLCDTDEFAVWAGGRKQWRMEYFYRDMRKKHHVLMRGDQPEGGKWNFDHDNRQPPNDTLRPQKPFYVEPDEITQAVFTLVEDHFGEHFGNLHPFSFAVTRRQARKALDHFITHNLPQFGDYQDAMVQGDPWMFHSHLSFYLNIGLLNARECIAAAENAFHQQQVPLNCVEGFIRQILGWREYVRGLYWYLMPGYETENFFNADRPLPDFFWDGKTHLNCLRQVILETRDNGYAHHIQRLMVIGNFALLAGLSPKQVNEWFLIVYMDAFEWVEMPNVTGMALFADGGRLASKPYAASGSYIHKMSNYCASCQYDVRKKNGPKACPFNYLYWDFLARNRDRLADNHRLGLTYRTLDRMSDEKNLAIQEDARRFFKQLTF